MVVLVDLDDLGTLLAAGDHHFDANQVIRSQTHGSSEHTNTSTKRHSTYTGGFLSSARNGVPDLPQRSDYRPLGDPSLDRRDLCACINVNLVHITHVNDDPIIQR
ncbi:hypothetical protein KSX_02260 [Ktedonospora formicarum]|uniref:Uncharacterized protein n=1 Tax=Ktedonospora formicarum TaxID=2778364 RepID=A0A8J3HWU3_9CHLR|nr:hypothetical protein KSX_02260 [Ktedonospora formicarum]